jgi:phage I-like protein
MVEVLRTGRFSHPGGEVEITRRMLAEMVLNFNAKTYGQNIFVDVAHKPSAGAAGEITQLWVDGDKLLASVEWTPYGLAAIRERGFRFLSAEFSTNWLSNELPRQLHGAVLLGAALTLRPAVKGLEAIT